MPKWKERSLYTRITLSIRDTKIHVPVGLMVINSHSKIAPEITVQIRTSRATKGTCTISKLKRLTRNASQLQMKSVRKIPLGKDIAALFQKTKY